MTSEERPRYVFPQPGQLEAMRSVASRKLGRQRAVEQSFFDMVERASAHARFALAGFALGADRTEVLLHLSESRRAFVELINYRDVIHKRVEPKLDDWSFVSSRDSLFHMCGALLAGDTDAAQFIAAYVWDPPGAPWVGPRSETCTPADQHLAKAVAQLIRGDVDEARQAAALVRSNDKRRLAQARTVVELSRRAQTTIDALQMVVRMSAENFRREQSSGMFDARILLNVPALGLGALALRDGVVTRDALLALTDPQTPMDWIVDLG